MADGTGQGAGSGEIVFGGYGVVWEWEFVFAEQYAGAVSRAAVSGDNDSRQCRGGAPAADGGVEGYASARGDRIFDGGAAGVSVGGELSDICGPAGGDFGHGEDLRAWHCAAGKRDWRDYDGRCVSKWRVQGATEERDRRVCVGVGRMAFFAGVVASRDVAGGRQAGDNV